MEASFLFGSQEKPGSQQDPGGARRPFLAIFACFPLVSDGPMVQDLCNETKRKVSDQASNNVPLQFLSCSANGSV